MTEKLNFIQKNINFYSLNVLNSLEQIYFTAFLQNGIKNA